MMLEHDATTTGIRHASADFMELTEGIREASLQEQSKADSFDYFRTESRERGNKKGIIY